MTAILDFDGFKTRTIMPSGDVDGIEADSPGFIDGRIVVAISWIESKLRKRYDVPFVAPVPEVVFGWIVAIVTPEAYRRRGWDPGEAQSAQIEQDRKDAREQVQEAADSFEGLYDLTLRSDTTESGISKGGPRGYAETSPYVWTDHQFETAIEEDRNER